MAEQERVILGFHKMKFSLGQMVATPHALHALAEANQTIGEFLERHVQGDWGVVDAHDWNENDKALKPPHMRILSAYVLKTGVKIWIITEWDRSVTTLLLPEDY